MKVLVACEESQEVCKAFRERGHEAYSCDLQDCSGGHPEWHIKDDVTRLLNPGLTAWSIDNFPNVHTAYGIEQLVTCDGKRHQVMRWDLIIAHPPCTDLASSGARWFPEKRADGRQLKSINFFLRFVNADCERIAIENPVGIMSRIYGKPDQIIQPYQFGDPYEKRTCLWLKGLPVLKPTNQCAYPERVRFESGKSMPKWYADAWSLSKDERSKLRSKTFPGIACAMAEQWG